MQGLFQGWSAKKFETWGPTSTQAGKRAAPVTEAHAGANGLIHEWKLTGLPGPPMCTGTLVFPAQEAVFPELGS